MNTRFTAYTKARLVRNYLDGEDVSKLMKTNLLDWEELDSWISKYKKFGVNSLRTTKLQEVRRRSA